MSPMLGTANVYVMMSAKLLADFQSIKTHFSAVMHSLWQGDYDL